MKNTFIITLIFAIALIGLPRAGQAQIGSVKVQDAKAIITNESKGRIIVEVCGDCRLGGYNQAYVVIYNRSKAVIYNNSGKMRSAIAMRPNYKIIEVNNDYIIIDDGAYYLYYDFQGKYQKRDRINY